MVFAEVMQITCEVDLPKTSFLANAEYLFLTKSSVFDADVAESNIDIGGHPHTPIASYYYHRDRMD